MFDYIEQLAPTTFAISAKTHGRRCALSVVVPVCNEEESLPPLYQRLTEVLAAGPRSYSVSYEIVFVDDGSTDRSFDVCAHIQRQDERVRVIQFRRNFGKTAALHAGFSIARGERIITIDADMQEDPGDMFQLLGQLDQGYDLVSAWRKQRNDPVSKTLPSRIFNAVVARLTGVPLHDFNCGFKAYSREVVEDLRLYGELHRFIPVLARQRGFRVTEVAVAHQRRRFGKSKFGARRLGRGYLDFIQVLFLTTYLRRPLRLFGMVGTAFFGVGLVICLYMSWLWLNAIPIGTRPLLLFGVLMLITGLQFISTGLVGEMLRNSTFRPGDDYAIRRIIGNNQDTA
ncbi:MAG: glycosyltransferase family 2 protein [Chloroflexaceae bacterium]|jgi:glycosyltransferase involved in cell wall biosynthesis|nr:glycosyltransferase family 2 protein [Chloroflexaceae bacterium]